MKLVLVSLLCLVCWVQAAPSSYQQYPPTYSNTYPTSYNSRYYREGKAIEHPHDHDHHHHHPHHHGEEVEAKAPLGVEEEVVPELQARYGRDSGEDWSDELVDNYGNYDKFEAGQGECVTFKRQGRTSRCCNTGDIRDGRDLWSCTGVETEEAEPMPAAGSYDYYAN